MRVTRGLAGGGRWLGRRGAAGAESREEEAGAPLVPLRTEEAALCCPGYSGGSGVGGRGTETVDCVTFFFFWSFTFKRQDINAVLSIAAGSQGGHRGPLSLSSPLTSSMLRPVPSWIKQGQTILGNVLRDQVCSQRKILFLSLYHAFPLRLRLGPPAASE